MHMANEQYQQNSHKWKTWQLGFQTSLGCFTVRPVFFNQADNWNEEFIFFFFFFFFFFWGGGGGGGGGGVCSAPMHIYYLVLYTDLKAAEGN